MNTSINENITTVISPKTAFEKNILPIKIENGIFHVALSNKDNLRLVKDLSFDTGMKIETVEMPADVIIKELKELYPGYDSNNGNGSRNNIKDHSLEYSNVEFVNQVIANAVKFKASDIHFESLEKSFRIRFRIDGHLRETAVLSKSKGLPVISRLKIMANLDISEKRRPQDGRIKFNFENREVDIRVSSLPANYGEKIVLRILDRSQLKLDLHKLGLNSEQLKIMKKYINLPYGMLLVTGPTGSGKTTTLYAALQSVHSIEKNIITIEDPVEYNLEGINQCNVNPGIGFTFANALRSFLRQDPDIIMVGEIRDRETAEIAIRASLTGHLVFSTLHTNDSVSGITRLIDMGIEPFLVSASVKMIIAQRLVRTLCDCKIEETGESTKSNLGVSRLFNKNGCAECNETGYIGRTALFEILEIKDDLAEMISQNRSAREIKKAAAINGFKSLREAGIEKINKGITGYEEVLHETMF